tara:strand:+ start:628 stop:1071 length:444 start_codon:yes stop_codon:yes gene_type:complete
MKTRQSQNINTFQIRFNVPDIDNAKLPKGRNACGVYACAVLIEQHFSTTENWFLTHYKKKDCIYPNEMIDCLTKHGKVCKIKKGFNGKLLKTCIQQSTHSASKILFITSTHAVVGYNGYMNERNYNGWIEAKEYKKKKWVQLAFEVR